MPLDVATRQVAPDTAVVTLVGSLTLGTSLKIADTQIQSLISSGVSHIVLDLTGVNYVDSAGLGALVHTYGLTQQSNGSLRLCGVQKNLAAMLKMTRADAFLPIDPTAEASLAAIESART
jgi:anti-sigma B factor antagonist